MHFSRSRFGGGSLNAVKGKSASRFILVRSHGHANDPHEVHLGHNVISKVSALNTDMKFQEATVVKNEAASLDGNVRLLTLSVADDVEMLYGRKSNKMEGEKLCDSFTMPGQFVALKRKETGALCSHLFSLASSPYESHRDSYGIDASMIQIGVDALHGGADDKAIAVLGPGAELDVSQVIGRGFASLLGSSSSIPSAIESGSPMLLIGIGNRGLISLRPLLNWTPVLAHAGSKKVSAIYLTKNSQSAAFLPGWDLWREAGIDFTPIYSEIYDPELPTNKDESLYLLEKALFLRPGGLSSLCSGPPSSCTVVIAGASGELASLLVKKLSSAGVQSDSILFCDFF